MLDCKYNTLDDNEDIKYLSILVGVHIEHNTVTPFLHPFHLHQLHHLHRLPLSQDDDLPGSH